MERRTTNVITEEKITDTKQHCKTSFSFSLFFLFGLSTYPYWPFSSGFEQKRKSVDRYDGNIMEEKRKIEKKDRQDSHKQDRQKGNFSLLVSFRQ